VVDTNVAIDLIRLTAEYSRFHPAATVYVPVTVLGELYHGAFNAQRQADALAEVEDFAFKTKVLVCDLGTSRRFGEVRQHCWRKGKPIPDNDIWIAAIALIHGLPLVTRDQHFNEIDGLTVIGW
jgi:tRNA(fMet)-specific endonuclease VapC